MLSPEERASLQRDARDPDRREAFRRARQARPKGFPPDRWLKFLSAASVFFPSVPRHRARGRSVGERYLL